VLYDDNDDGIRRDEYIFVYFMFAATVFPLADVAATVAVATAF